MYIRAPIWLKAVGKPGASAFATLFALESCTRAILATILVVDVQQFTGSAQLTSLVFFGVAFFGFCANFTIPHLARLLGRRWVYTLGIGAVVGASLVMLTGTLATQAAGMALRVFGVVCFNVCLNLYILDTLKGQQINRLEPLRIFLAAIPWTFGPALGVSLASDIDRDVPYLLSIGFACVLLVYFWILRTQERSPLPVQRQAPPNPLRHVLRFLATPRLRLSYMIAITRSTYWSMFFVYGPIYCLENGLGEKVGGYLVSAGNAFLFLAPLIGRAARFWGIRRLILVGFSLTTLAAFGAWLFSALPWTGAALLLAGACGAVLLDVTGNIPFLRLVRPSERQTMTPLFATYREFSDFVPPGIYALLLLGFKLPVVFFTTALWQLSAAAYALRLPKRL